MGNTFREVQCYKCGHIFMWQKDGIEYQSEYRLESTNEHRDECLQKKQDAECPKCGTDMLAIPHVLEGISKDSSGIVEAGIRGI